MDGDDRGGSVLAPCGRVLDLRADVATCVLLRTTTRLKAIFYPKSLRPDVVHESGDSLDVVVDEARHVRWQELTSEEEADEMPLAERPQGAERTRTAVSANRRLQGLRRHAKEGAGVPGPLRVYLSRSVVAAGV
jgi:hypothetical protein